MKLGPGNRGGGKRIREDQNSSGPRHLAAYQQRGIPANDSRKYFVREDEGASRTREMEKGVSCAKKALLFSLLT